MSRLKKALRVVKWLGLVLAIIGVVLALSFGRLVRFAMTPSGAFDAEAPPKAPDYDSPESWSALPDREDLADRVPASETALDQRQAGVDVFYVHPTSYVGSRWNAPTDDKALNEATDRVATGIQASVLNGCCAVYAPRYRQANGTSFISPSEDGDRAIALAVADIQRAFAVFNAQRGAERPFILAAHSQGSIVAEHLLYEAISGGPLRDKLVAAYLIGGGITTAALHERAPDIPVCSGADDLHCVVAYNARGPEYTPTEFDLDRRDTSERVCTNPLTFRSDGAFAPKERNLGAVFLETDDRSVRPAFADAQCAKGTLIVAHIDKAPRDLPSRLLDHVMGSGNYHPIEYQIFFMNLRQNAAARVAAYSAARKP